MAAIVDSLTTLFKGAQDRDFSSIEAAAVGPQSPGFMPNIAESSEYSAEEREFGRGSHSILKKTDYWFNVELAQLERWAKEEADQHARAGLPRMDVPLDGELPAEQILRERAIRIFIEWSERVKRKMQDAIQHAADSATVAYETLRETCDDLERTRQDVNLVRRELTERSEHAAKDRAFEYGSLLKGWKYKSLTVLLVAVDWVANLPVFLKLLPQEVGSSSLDWGDMAERANRYGPVAGLVRLGERILFRPEVSLLALGVVVFLMVLGHFAGSSLRRLIAFRSTDEATRIIGLKPHRRQALLPLVGALIGISLVVGFLYQSRAALPKVAQATLQQATDEQDRSQRQMNKEVTGDGGSTRAQELREEVVNKTAQADQARVEEEYAENVQKMNLPIAMLNLTLVIVALIAAYLENSARISEAKFADPGLQDVRDALTRLEAEASETRRTRTQLFASTQGHISAARYLAQAPALRDWEAKARRLEAVIPLFRTENARLRGIDVQNISSFKQPCQRLDLPAVTERSFEVPAEVEVCAQNLGDLRIQILSMGTQS